MCLACSFLDKTLMLEAIFECSLGIKNQREVYNRFCDRLELRKIPFLVVFLSNIYKLEMPFPRGYLFTVDENAPAAGNNSGLSFQDTSHVTIPNIVQQQIALQNPPPMYQQPHAINHNYQEVVIPANSTISLKDRALLRKQGI